jgi:hypothetical protein
VSKDVTPVVLTQPKKGWVDYVGLIVGNLAATLMAAVIVSAGLGVLFPGTEWALGYWQSVVAVIVARYLIGADNGTQFWLLTRGSK